MLQHLALALTVLFFPTMAFAEGGLKLPAGAMIGLHAADLGTTFHALSSGKGREANGVMAPIVGSPAGAIALKAGVTAGTIYIASKLQRKHPTGAKVMLWTLNGVLAGVVANNVRVIRR